MVESARHTARHLTAVLDAAESGILVVDEGNRVTLLNRVAAGLLGTTEKYLLGRNLPEVTELLAGRSRNAHLVPDRLPRVPAGGGAERPTCTGELEILTDPPTVVRVSDAPVRDGRERVGRIFVLTDITREKDALARLEEFYDEAIRALAAGVEARDPYTQGHSVRVSRYAVMIGKGLGLTPEQLRILRYAGLLHDIGKLAVEDRILRKAGPLTPEERQAIKQHPVVGAAILGSAKSFAALAPAVRHHHERYDGTGYPDGLAGEAIPLEARILAVADAFDAMTSDRPYRPAFSQSVACERLMRGRGTQFDPRVVDTFLTQGISLADGEITLLGWDRESMEGILALARLLREHRPAVALTGAGISTESGIPDFRSPGTGLWNYVDPSEHLSATALRGRPAEFWQIFGRVFGPVLKAQPNPGHLALSRLWSAGYLRCIVTQNIDGLHQKANCARVLEIHGHLRTARCERCGALFPLGPVLARLDREPVPLCPCGGYLRPDVVLFEDPMPPAFDEALAQVRAASLLLVVGSSLTVWPASSLAYLVPHLGIINRDPTPADGSADVVVRGSAARVLVALCAALGVEEPAGGGEAADGAPGR